jgi:dihydrofolate reductase
LAVGPDAEEDVMRKLTSSFFMSLDGVVDAPHDWHFPYMDDQMAIAVGRGIADSDTMLLGRATYEEWAGFWPNQPDENPMAEYFNTTPKLVVSTTLDKVDWQNSTLIAGDVEAAVSHAKQQPGKDISITGSGTLVRSLLLADLIDELRLMIHPIVVGRGKRLFENGDRPKALELANSETYASGVLSLTYRRNGIGEAAP